MCATADFPLYNRQKLCYHTTQQLGEGRMRLRHSVASPETVEAGRCVGASDHLGAIGLMALCAVRRIGRSRDRASR